MTQYGGAFFNEPIIEEGEVTLIWSIKDLGWHAAEFYI